MGIDEIGEECDHVIGLGSTAEDQIPRLVMKSQKDSDAGESLVIEHEFNYCPECGKRLVFE
jgi:hypothetical protein